MRTNEELLLAANVLKNHCGEVECEDCIFYLKNGNDYNCALIVPYSPCSWDLSPPHWIEHLHSCRNMEYPIYECSKCHESSDYDSDYCPNCKAYMKGK